MEIGGRQGFVLAPGCDLPCATPPENLEAVSKLVNDPYEAEVIRNFTSTRESGEMLDMEEYGQSDRVIVDLITLDAEA